LAEWDPEAWQEVRVEGTIHEAEGVMSLILGDSADGSLPRWMPGAHIDLRTPSGIVRQYSLCGDASEDRWRIAVLDEPAGRGGSRSVHRECRPGSIVAIRGPRNRFPLVSAPRYLFIAGGIGITPLLPMLATVDSTGAGWSLLYGGRTRRSMAFLSTLDRFGDRVSIRPQDEFGLLDLERAIRSEPANAAVYCCGPEALIAAVEAICLEIGRPPPLVERFSPKSPEPIRQPNRGFQVVLAADNRTLEVGSDDTVLDVLIRAGIDVNSDCREGTCGTCETVVLDGAIEHRDSSLSAAERAAGDIMLVCVSRAASDRLVLDL
jgi:ferredoxin-NADP reductase